jgi:hypothetical protein
MGQVINGRTERTKTRIRSQASRCEIYGGQSGTGIGFMRVRRFYLISFIPPFFMCTSVLPEGQTGTVWVPSIKELSFGNEETLSRKLI